MTKTKQLTIKKQKTALIVPRYPSYNSLKKNNVTPKDFQRNLLMFSTWNVGVFTKGDIKGAELRVSKSSKLFKDFDIIEKKQVKEEKRKSSKKSKKKSTKKSTKKSKTKSSKKKTSKKKSRKKT